MSKFIPYNKIKELREASKGGNEKAKAIIDKYMDHGDMAEIDAMISDYYGNAGIDTLGKVEDPQNEAINEVPADAMPETETVVEEDFAEVDETADGAAFTPQEGIVDISEDLDRELEGIISEDEYKDVSFRDFLKDKKGNALKERKNAEYFKAFDQVGREKYLNDKKASYGMKFDMNRKSINRSFKDTDNALNSYSQMVTGFAMDDGDIDVAKASDAYNEFTDSEEAMGAFGRGWDDEDTQEMRIILEELAKKYGKRNIIAMLNSLKEDNSAWKTFSEGKIDDAIGNYGKSLEKLLK